MLWSPQSTGVFAVAFAFLVPGPVLAQIPEVEPNSSKFHATPVACMGAGDFLTGVSTGATIGGGAVDSADYFRIRTCALPLAIYEHTLTLASGTPGQIATIRGLSQVGIVGMGGKPVLGTDVEVQPLIAGTNRWYGFGQSEDLFVRIEGTPATPGAYTHTLATVPAMVTPLGSFEPGVITISTAGMGHLTDTELWVYNANLDPIAGYGNDDTIGPPVVFQASLTRFYAPGSYYLAVSAFNLANDEPAPLDDNAVIANVLDYPRAILGNGGAAGVPVDFSITDVFGVTPFIAAMGSPGEVLWFRFQVGSPMIQNCFPGVGATLACPCGQPANPVGGCANFGVTATTGAVLEAFGNASLAADTVVLTTLNHRTAPVAGILNVFFTGEGAVGLGVPNGAGVRCVSTKLKRLYYGQAMAGTVSKPGMGDPSVSFRCTMLGVPISAGQTRHYFNVYRDVSATGPCGNTAANVNTTNAGSITWGP